MTFHELFGELSDDSDSESPVEVTAIPHSEIPGLCLMKGVLPLQLQQELLPNLQSLFDVASGENQAMRFGSNFPLFLSPLMDIGCQLLPPHLQQRKPVFDQMIANHYTPGQGISAHVDLARFEDGVVIFSFLSSLVMDFTHVGEPVNSLSYSLDSFPESNNGTIIPVLLETGSAVCLSGEARYNWTHGIAERMVDQYDNQCIQRKERISITLRKMKPNQILS
ncbi:alkylated DNA repair protein alkB 8 [Obelidium mucronatum]|nr:alkylated DNA repair protein alkB 8 [Obelidium mucronatum]